MEIRPLGHKCQKELTQVEGRGIPGAEDCWVEGDRVQAVLGPVSHRGTRKLGLC